jgi:hypothetical protein
MDPLATSGDFFVLEDSIAFRWFCDFNVSVLVYYQHPEMKVIHWLCSSSLENLAPFVGPICFNQEFELVVNAAAI